MDTSTAQRKIEAIDKRIDAVRAELLRNVTVDEMSAASWQAAWDRHPVLHAIEASLYSRRYDASSLRDKLAAKDARATERREALEMRRKYEAKHSNCPACGQLRFAA